MSVTLTIHRRGHQIGGLESRLADVLFDNSYLTGGMALSGSELGLANILAAQDTGSGVGDGPYRFKYDRTNKKLQVYRGGPGGTQVYAEADIKGSVNTNALGAGNYITIPVNGNLWVTLADAANTTPFTVAVQPDIARNVGILIKDATGGNTNGAASDYVIVGTFRGAAQTETISFTLANLTTMSNGNIAAKYGVKPFDSITSITPSIAQTAGFQAGVGPGSLIGLPWDLLTPAESDIIKLTKNAADLPKTGLYSVTNKTVNFGVLADGDDVSVEANTPAGMVEVANGADLSAVTARFMFWG